MQGYTSAAVAYAEQTAQQATGGTRGAQNEVEGQGRRDSQIGRQGVTDTWGEVGDVRDIADDMVEGMDNLRTAQVGDADARGDLMGKVAQKAAGKVLDRLPFWLSVVIVGACIIAVFVVGLMHSYGELTMEYKIQQAAGLSLAVALLDTLKERVVCCTNHNIKELNVPGHDHFQIGRELAFAWAWLPLSLGTYHPQTAVGIFFEMCVGGAQAMIGSIKTQDLGEGWANGFIIAGISVAIPAMIYCLVVDKVHGAVHTPVVENFFTWCEKTWIGKVFLKGLGFMMSRQKDLVGLVSADKFGNDDVEMDAEVTDEDLINPDFDDREKWIFCDPNEAGAIPIFPEGETQSMVPPPSSIIALSMPFIGSAAVVTSVILYSILFHDIYVDKPENRIINAGSDLANGLDISQHALSAAQLLMIIGWMAVSLVSGMTYTDLEMKKTMDEIVKDKNGVPKPRETRIGFEWIELMIPESLRNHPTNRRWKDQIDKAYSYPSAKEFVEISTNPSGVVEGLPRLFSGDFFNPFEGKIILAALVGNFAKYLIVVRSLIFATFDNDDQGFLLWYVVPEGIIIILTIIYFYRQSWSISVYVRSHPEYMKRKRPPPPVREIQIPPPPPPLPPPPHLFIQQAPGSGVVPLAGYARGPTVPNIPHNGHYAPTPGVPLPASVYAVPDPAHPVLPRLHIPGMGAPPPG